MTIADHRIELDLAAVAPALANGLPQIFDELEVLFVDLNPEYAAFIAGNRDVVTAAAQGTVDLLINSAQRILNPNSAGADENDAVERGLFEEIGRIQCREGVAVGTLLSAYQLGARVCWRRMSETALRMGLAPAALAALAEAIFCFVDRLSSASAAGYSAEQAEFSIAHERSRDELAELLLSDRSDSAAVAAAAARVGWPIPETAAVVFVERHNEIGREMVSRLDPSCLAVRTATLFGAIVPEPAAPGRRERLTTKLRGSSAVIGHAVELQHLPASARIAEIAARLQRENVLTQDPIFVDEHLDAIIVHRDQRLLDGLRQQCLAPLAGASTTSREALRETLRSWLRNMGDRRLVAADLHVHHQTVRYRLARLRELFGDDLDDPQMRFKMLLALSWDH